MKRLAFGLCLVLASCTGAPVREGTLPGGVTFKDYSREPYGYLRVSTFPDGRSETRDLHTEKNFENLRAGLSAAEVEDLVGPSIARAKYANGTSSWSYRYRDTNIAKLLHVIFGPDGRVLRYETQWDPNVYSKKSR